MSDDSDWGSDEDEDPTPQVVPPSPQPNIPKETASSQPISEQPQAPVNRPDPVKAPEPAAPVTRPKPNKAPKPAARDDVSAVLVAMQALHRDATKLSEIQPVILRKLLGGFHQSATQQLGLAGSDDELNQQVVKALASHLRQAAESFKSINKTAAPGSLEATSKAFQSFVRTIHPFLKPGGLIAESGNTEASSANMDADLARAEAKLAALRNRVASLKTKTKAEGSKLKSLKSNVADLKGKQEKAKEEQLRMQTRKKELIEKKQTMVVLESGMKDLSALMHKELEGKVRMRENMEDLATLQTGTRVTWVSPEAYDTCLACGDHFEMFGDKEKTWCRNCGRLYCQSCTQSKPLPKLHSLPKKGYNQAVPVCTRCVDFCAKYP